ncbi:MAG: hypothetical protein ACT4PT_05690 [Methanobacteriota archaeon]
MARILRSELAVARTGALAFLVVAPAVFTIVAATPSSVILTDDFNDATTSTATWNSIQGGGHGTGCGAHSGSTALYFDGGGSAFRSAQTKLLDVSAGATITFWLRIGNEPAPSGCENADAEDEEDVILRVTGANALSRDLAVYDSEDFPTWTQATFVYVPSATSLTDEHLVRFQWFQGRHSVTLGSDQWAIDDVVISGPSLVPRTASGALGFVGEALLPVFPCAAPIGAPCEGGTFQADLAGTITGTYGAASYTIGFDTTTKPLQGDFVYEEFLCGATTGLLAGRANGRGEISMSGLSGSLTAIEEISGQWVLGDTTTAITSFRMTFDFEWLRTGTSAVLSLQDVVVDIGLPHLPDRRIVDGADLAGVATFVPQGSGGAHVPSCDEPDTDVVGRFAGETQIGWNG